MQKELCFILANKLLGLPFVQVLAGMVQTVSVQVQDETNSTTLLKKFPVATDTNLVGTCDGITGEQPLMPDSSRASMIYFEDKGITPEKSHGRFNVYKSTVRLVCWLNKEKLYTNPPGNVTGTMMVQILQRLENLNPINIGIFTRLVVRLQSIPPQDAAIFSAYTYQETDRQYLRPPFDFFAIDLSAKFMINPHCLPS